MTDRLLPDDRRRIRLPDHISWADVTWRRQRPDQRATDQRDLNWDGGSVTLPADAAYQLLRRVQAALGLQ